MSLFADFMDDVPVKISERYKPPPRIELGRGALKTEERAQRTLAAADYGFEFESRVLGKLGELRAAKETIASERRHRLRLLEQRRLDRLAAAEAEERLKQLSVSEVSYPSTDEISEMSPDDVVAPVPVPATPPVLQPVQLSACVSRCAADLDLLADPDPLRDFQLNSIHSRYSYTTRNVDELTFSDFENDTSSPFDNMELKSINDLDLLAQILHNGKSNEPNPSYGMGSSRVSSAAFPEPYSCVGQPILGHSNLIYSPPGRPCPVPVPYFLSHDNNCDSGNMSTMCAPGYDCYPSDGAYPSTCDGYYVPATLPSEPREVLTTSEATTLVPQTYNYYGYRPVPSDYRLPLASGTELVGRMKSRSRSVPDIVKELSEEVASERVRADERCSASAQPSAAPTAVPTTAARDPLAELPAARRDLCRSIGRMGFPLQRVATVCTLLGDDNKKVVEGLLLVGQLMELGFSESRVAAALAKHQFNRDKALEELIA